MNYWGWSEQLRRSGHRLVLEMQSEWLSQMDPASVKKQLAYVDAVVPVSRHVERLFRDAFPGFPGVVATIHNGVDVDVFHPAGSGSDPDPSASARLLFVGRVSPEKGVHTLLDAFARVVGRFPSATLDIIGPRTELPSRLLVDLSTDTLVRDLRRFYHEGGSNYQEYLNDLVRKHRLAEQVRFHGSLGHHEIVKHYQAAGIVVNPSLSETFGISMVEGMACGVPVVGTQVGGMLDTVTSEVGRLVPAEDPARLADAVCEILADRAAAKKMGVAGRARSIQDFTWNVRAQRLRRLYQSICAKSQAPAT
jgi:glycosyltransferase involved in cell wall biosynthesis